MRWDEDLFSPLVSYLSPQSSSYFMRFVTIRFATQLRQRICLPKHTRARVLKDHRRGWILLCCIQLFSRYSTSVVDTSQPPPLPTTTIMFFYFYTNAPSYTHWFPANNDPPLWSWLSKMSCYPSFYNIYYILYGYVLYCYDVFYVLNYFYIQKFLHNRF